MSNPFIVRSVKWLMRYQSGHDLVGLTNFSVENWTFRSGTIFEILESGSIFWAYRVFTFLSNTCLYLGLASRLSSDNSTATNFLKDFNFNFLFQRSGLVGLVDWVFVMFHRDTVFSEQQF